MIAESTKDVLMLPPMPGYAEQRRFAGNVFRANDGTERRESLLFEATDGPVRMVDYTASGLTAQECAYVENMIHKMAQNGTLYAPLWLSMSTATEAVSGTRVNCDTRYREFSSVSKVLISTPDFSAWEYRTIDAVEETYIDVTSAFTGSTFEEGALVLPLIEVTPIGDSTIRHRLDSPRSVQLQFEELTGSSLNPAEFTPDEYVSTPIFPFAPNGIMSESLVKERELQGDDWSSRETYGQEIVERIQSFSVLLTTIEERKELIDFFDGRLGRFGPFWNRSRKVNFVLQADASLGATTLRVIPSAETPGLTAVIRHIFIRGLASHHKITNITEGSGYHTITITPGISTAIRAATRIENLYYQRFDQDVLRLETSSMGPGIVESSVRLRELQKETP